MQILCHEEAVYDDTSTLKKEAISRLSCSSCVWRSSDWGLAFTFIKVWFASYLNFLHWLNNILIYALDTFIKCCFISMCRYLLFYTCISAVAYSLKAWRSNTAFVYFLWVLIALIWTSMFWNSTANNYGTN